MPGYRIKSDYDYYDYLEIDKIRKQFEREKNGNLMQYTYWLEKRILRAELIIEKLNSKIKSLSDKIELILNKGRRNNGFKNKRISSFKAME